MDFKIRNNVSNLNKVHKNHQDISWYFVLNESLKYIEKHDPENFYTKNITSEDIPINCGKNINNYYQSIKTKNSQSIEITISKF